MVTVAAVGVAAALFGAVESFAVGRGLLILAPLGVAYLLVAAILLPRAAPLSPTVPVKAMS